MEKLSKKNTDITLKQSSKPRCPQEPLQGSLNTLHTDNDKLLKKDDPTSVPQNTQIDRKEYILSNVAAYVVNVQNIEVSPNVGT